MQHSRLSFFSYSLMRVLHVCNGMREYDFFFFTFSSSPPLSSPAFLLRPFLSLPRACRRPRRVDRRRSTCKSSRFLSPYQLKRRRVSPPSSDNNSTFPSREVQIVSERRGAVDRRRSRAFREGRGRQASLFLFFFPRFFRRKEFMRGTR